MVENENQCDIFFKFFNISEEDSLYNGFKDILENFENFKEACKIQKCLDERKEKKGSQTWPDLANFIFKQLPEELINIINENQELTTEYAASGAHWQGNLFDIPWVSVYDSEKWSSVKEGYYPVYLFKGDLSGFYLSLEIATTPYYGGGGDIKKSNISSLISFKDNFKKAILDAFNNEEGLDFNLTDFSDEIDLGGDEYSKAVGYECSAVFSKFYSADDLPSEETLRQDLINCLKLYEFTKAHNIFENIKGTGINDGEDLDNNLSNIGIGDQNVDTVNYWLYAPGEQANKWEEFYNDNIMAIGWDIGDLKRFKNKKEIIPVLQELYNDKSNHPNDTLCLWQFSNEIQVGDIIFAKKGVNEIIGRGIVESDYKFDDTRDEYKDIIRVNWTDKGSWPYGDSKNKLAMKTLTKITDYKALVEEINSLIGGIVISDPPHYPTYTEKEFLDEVYVSEYDYKTLVNLLKNKKNLIVQGAPGVGKTFTAKRLAYSIMGVKDVDRVMMVQFHQSYSYEDFVMGYRPSKDGFELREGSFYKFCKKAEDDDEYDYFFIIDEINRGNLSKIFGELFMLIENDKRGEKNKIQLLYSDELFYIPKNVHIIGLMNTADRSLAMIDYALRRRFAFFDLKPGFDSNGFKAYQSEVDYSIFNNIINVMKELNYAIKEDETLGEGFRIGHSYFCNLDQEDDVEEKLNYIVEYEIIPLLKEYWFDEPDKVDEWSEKLRNSLNE